LRLAILVLGHLFDDGRLAHSRTFRARKPGQFTHLVECVLNIMNIAMKLVDLGHDPLDRVFRALLVGQDQQVILGDNFVSQANLVQEQLQTGLETNALELELDGILGLDVEPIERGQVEHDRQAQLAAESLDDIGQQRGPGEPERIRFQKRVLDRVGRYRLRRFSDHAGNRPGSLSFLPGLGLSAQGKVADCDQTHHQASDKK